MKKLFTYAFAIALSLSANAQDPSTWTEGQDVAAELGLGDIKGTFSGEATANDNGDYDVKSIGNYWKGSTPVEYHPDGGVSDPGIIGFYNVDLVDVYQIVKIPAGSYTFKAQALYREGTPQDNFKNHFSGKFTKNGHMYVSFLDGNGEDAKAVRDFDRVLVTLAASGQTGERIFYDGDGSWKNDAEWTVTTTNDDGEQVKVNYYCPCCLPGLAQYFAAGKYENELNFVATEDTYIKIGFRKTGVIKQDWLPFTNIRVIYNGPADEEAQKDLAAEEIGAAVDQLEELQAKIDEAGFNGLAGAIGDIIMEEGEAYDEETSIDSLLSLLAKLNGYVDSYNRSLVNVNTLADLLNMSSDMLASTAFEGYEAFQAAYDKAKADAGTSDVAKLGDNPGAYYDGIYAELSKARADYLNSQPADERGAKDFTALIKSPWFVNPEHTPTLVNGNWELTDAPDWNVWEGPDAYTTRVNSGRPDIASKVDVATDDKVTNQWYKYFGYTEGWCAGIDMMSGSHLVSMSTGWSSGFVGEAGVRQQLVGLPNGYYSVNCLVKGWDSNGTWNSNPKILGCMAQTSTGEAQFSNPSNNIDNWWSWGWDWDDVQSSIVLVEDGKLLIGGGGSISNQVTGFRLSFYGEAPDFNGMMQDKIAYINGQVEDLLFKGDIKYVNELIASIALPVAGPDAYTADCNIIKQAQERIDAAKKAQNDYSAINTLSSIEYEFATPAAEYFIAYGESEEDDYSRVAELNGIANAYKDYAEVYANAKEINDAFVNGIIAEQEAEMKAAMQTEATVKQYLEDLAVPYNIALLSARGGQNASEANPVNFSQVIINSSFSDDPTTGWTGETPTNNEYAFNENGVKTNAELWNKKAFTLSQTIKNLPAGTYELRVKAIYRDGGAVDEGLVNAYNEAGNEEAWANHNALLFAKTSDDNKQTSYIKAIESLKYTENSFTEVGTAWDTEDMEDGSVKVFATKAIAIEGTEKTMASTATYDADAAEGAYPFDTKVGDYYYPSSMQGFYQVCKRHPEDVTNSVKITINQGDELTIGFEKTAAIDADWVIFDDFELYYLSGETLKGIATGVDKVAVSSATGASYNVAGQLVDGSYKGVVIQNGKKFIRK